MPTHLWPGGCRVPRKPAIDSLTTPSPSPPPRPLPSSSQALVIGLALSATALLVYLAGLCPAAAARFDACSGESYVVGALNSAAFRAAPRTSRFGGTSE
jgi:hypothetical protein